jgi:hypothetical protein
VNFYPRAPRLKILLDAMKSVPVRLPRGHEFTGMNLLEGAVRRNRL